MHPDYCMCKTCACFSLDIYVYPIISLQKIRQWSVRQPLSAREHTFHFALKLKNFFGRLSVLP